MNAINIRVAPVAAALALALAALGPPLAIFGMTLAMTGCVAEVRGGETGVVEPEPDMFLFGGYYDRGPYGDYGHRGFESRGWRR